jgi:hypothetical protein
MPAKLKPAKFRATDCHTLCASNPRNLPAGLPDLLHGWFEAGDNNETIHRKLKEFGHPISIGALANHRRKHLVREDQFVPIEQLGGDPDIDSDRKLSDLEILDRIIQAGAKGLNARTVRISPEMTMKAMELRLKVTQGSVFDNFMDAVSKAFNADDPGEPTPESPEAVLSLEELTQSAGDDDAADG